MSIKSGRGWRLIVVGLLLVAAILPISAFADTPANGYFERTWARTDLPVQQQQVSRTWMWGPEAFTGALREGFVESPGGQRTVQYFDKSRMEISDLGEDPDSIWYVTNGRLVAEMISGEMQTGLNTFEPRSPASVNVAGDADDTLGPTYASFANLLYVPLGFGDEPITSRVDRNGTVTDDPSLASYGVTAHEYVIETNHRVASVFWDFMTSEALVYEGGAYVYAPLFENPYYATGLPITEAYWANIKVAGVRVDVLIQCFERRCLTYTPSNDPAWRVEAGNVGQHYYTWRYGLTPPGGETPVTSPLPQMIWTDPYIYPEAAVTSVYVSNGYSTGSFSYKIDYERAAAFPGLYSLATVHVGSFNHDTRGFYEWLNWVITEQVGFNREHLCAQIYAAIEEPDTEIARRLREFELLFEGDEIGSGALAYWHFLFYPVFNARAGFNILAEEAVISNFEGVWRGFAAAKLHDPNLAFAEYASGRSFHRTWCG